MRERRIMFCAKCGNEAAEGAGYCGACGAKLVNPNRPQQSAREGRTFADSMEAYRRQQAKVREAQEAAENATLAAQEYFRLRSRRTNCVICGVFLAFAFGYLMQMPVQLSEDVGATVFMTALGAFWGLVFPFGFMPIKDYIVNHGFFILFAAVFVAVLFALVMMFALCAGIPYFFYLQSKIASAKRDKEMLQGYADMLADAAC